MVDTDEGAFVGRVAGLRDVVTFEGATYAEVEAAFRTSVDDYLAFCAERGEPPDRPYSGKIPLRVDPELHRRAAAQAQAAGISLNQWIARRLEQVMATPHRSHEWPAASRPRRLHGLGLDAREAARQAARRRAAAGHLRPRRLGRAAGDDAGGGNLTKVRCHQQIKNGTVIEPLLRG